ncbi:MAG: hypothetical protein WC969_00420 [Elusimicrobiota bacterium]
MKRPGTLFVPLFALFLCAPLGAQNVRVGRAPEGVAALAPVSTALPGLGTAIVGVNLPAQLAVPALPVVGPAPKVQSHSAAQVPAAEVQAAKVAGLSAQGKALSRELSELPAEASAADVHAVGEQLEKVLTGEGSDSSPAASAGPQPLPLSPSLSRRRERGQAGVVSAAPSTLERASALGTASGVKVCGVTDKAGVRAALGAAKAAKTDGLIVGFLVGLFHASNQELSAPAAADLLAYLRERASRLGVPVRVAFVTHHRNAGALIRMVERISRGAASAPDILQIHDDMPLDAIRRVKEAYPQVQILKALHIPRPGDERNLSDLTAAALRYAQQPYIDGLLLDVADLAHDRIGGTGLVGDWDAARAVIDEVHRKTGKPVALAGGIRPENAKEALELTGADLLDANSGFRSGKTEKDGRPVSKDRAAILSVLRRVGNLR